jgi:hypothetical protein
VPRAKPRGVSEGSFGWRGRCAKCGILGGGVVEGARWNMGERAVECADGIGRKGPKG